MTRPTDAELAALLRDLASIIDEPTAEHANAARFTAKIRGLHTDANAAADALDATPEPREPTPEQIERAVAAIHRRDKATWAVGQDRAYQYAYLAIRSFLSPQDEQ